MTQDNINKIHKLALAEAERSECKKRKVAAVIVDPDGNILASGFNRLAKGGKCEDEKGNTHLSVIHAEDDAIQKYQNLTGQARGNYPLELCTIFVTHQPCDNCQWLIDAKGMLTEIVPAFMKFDAGKLRYSLIPPEVTKGLAEVLTYGAKKYKPNNWKQVDSNDRYIDALYRHLEAWRSGEDIDSESGLHHLKHALTNVGFILYLETNTDGRKVSEND